MNGRKRFDAKKNCHINLYRIYNVATLSFRVLSHIRLHVLIFWLDSFTGKVTGNHISSIKSMGVSRKLPLNQCSDLHSQWQNLRSFSTYTMFRSSMELCLGDPWCCWRGSEHNKIRKPWKNMGNPCLGIFQWIGLRENFQESPIFDGKKHGFL